MKTRLLIVALCLLVSSCSSTTQEGSGGWKNDGATESAVKSQKKGIQDVSMHPSVETCGVKTCALQTYLEAQEKEGKFDLGKSEYFQNRFGSLLNANKEKDALLKSEAFQKFVKDFYIEYFSCDWREGVCEGKRAYTYDEQNFFWYVFLPRMVNDEFVRKRWWDEWEAEAIVQSIKEKYYATFPEKEALVQIYKDKLTEKAKKMDVSTVDKKRLKEDKKYFEQVVLTPDSGLYDQIAQEIPVSVIWPERWQLQDLTDFTIDLFFSKIAELWISKEYFYSSVGTSDENFKKLDDKIETMNKLYGLSQKMPYDRYARNDEIVSYVFTNLWEFNTKGDFNKDVLEVKHYILLQYSFGDKKLYSMPERVAKFRSVNNFMVENLYKYSKYMNDAPKL